MASRAFTLRGADLHVVVLDKDARSWFIADSSLRGYDGARNVREERSVGPKEPNRKQGEETKQSRWGFRGMTVRDWLPIVGALLIPVVIAAGRFLGPTWNLAPTR
jgi:hypothetical protein